MTSIDMKYTSLFSKLGFIEETTDNYIKKYSTTYSIEIEAEKQDILYKNNRNPLTVSPNKLINHKDFVVLECVNRLIEKGYSRTNISIIKDSTLQNMPDLIVYDKSGESLLAFDCRQWGTNYENEYTNFKIGKGKLFNYIQTNQKPKILCLYSSRLTGGLLDYHCYIQNLKNNNNTKKLYLKGIFESEIKPYHPVPSYTEEQNNRFLEKINRGALNHFESRDYHIKDGVLIRYLGKEEHVTIPSNVIHIGSGAFWDCKSLVSVVIPNQVKTIGGDAFYYCTKLRSINIPKSITGMGNDPFAGCPLLSITNESPVFVIENGVLYNNQKTRIIHYPIHKQSSSFDIPFGIKTIGKHTFYDCHHLQKVTIPITVECIENNVFAGCKNLIVSNYSPYFHIENGVLYNKEKTQLYSLIDNSKKTMIIPNTVKTIGKNSFWNCSELSLVQIPESVTRIGYNPFAGCTSLTLQNKSPYYSSENGILYNLDKTELISCSNSCIDNSIQIADTVYKIGRNAFCYCTNLHEIKLSPSVRIIDRGSFSNCMNLTKITLTENVHLIGSWAFAYCKSLKKIEIPEKSIIEDNAFSQCDAKITRF